MKAADRCQENFQSDRCKKERDHDSVVAIKRDDTHIGNWSGWTGEGDSKKQVARFQPKAPKLTRQIKRMTRANCAKDTNLMLTHRVGTKTATAMLTEVIKYLRGGR